MSVPIFSRPPSGRAASFPTRRRRRARPSTFGPVVNDLRPLLLAPVLRVDAALADAATADGRKAGETDAYLDLIARAADVAHGEGTRVALAQAFMAPAVERCRRAAPLASPMAGLEAALRALRKPVEGRGPRRQYARRRLCGRYPALPFSLPAPRLPPRGLSTPHGPGA